PNMADEWAANEVNEAVDVAPAFELESDLPEVKLFGKWNRQEVNVADISLVSYITVKEQVRPLPVFTLLCVKGGVSAKKVGDSYTEILALSVFGSLPKRAEAIRRRTTGTGRMRHLKKVQRRFKGEPIIMGFIGFFVKLIHIPINNIIVGA
ncbi:hypothetical protein PRIPAC_71473, partial [Pristionchus pacificus]|uniref:Uncharacterized protein n=1 Tax=Pristionchus pacificus TaxID=54126 RepID=A0A2A6C702_PRIPA